MYSKPPPDKFEETLIPLAKAESARRRVANQTGQYMPRRKIQKTTDLLGPQSAQTQSPENPIESSSPSTPLSVTSLTGQSAEPEKRPFTTEPLAPISSYPLPPLNHSLQQPQQIPRDFQVESLGDGRDPRLLCDSTGHLRYIGESSTLSLLDQARKLFRREIGESMFTEDAERYNMVDGRSFKVSSVPLQLPSKRLAERFIDSFEENVQDTTYVLDMTKFRRDINVLYNSPVSASKSNLCLLHLVIAIGGVYYTTPPLKISNDIPLEFELPRISYTAYFESGLGFLIDAVEDGDIWVVQAYLLVSIFFEIMCKRNASWIQLGVAIRYMQALGVGREWIDKSYKPDQQIHRKRLFRSLYIHDRLKSFALGRPLVCSNDDLDAYTLSEPLNNNDEAHIEMAKLCQIIGDIWFNVYRSKTIKSSVAQSLATRLKNWSSAFETFVRDKSLALTREGKESATELKPPMQRTGLIDLSHKIPWNRKYLLLLNLTYLNGIILLTRPFLFYVTTRGHNSTAGLDDEAVRTFDNLATTCVQSALTSIRLVESTFYVNAQPKRSPSITYFVFTCGVVLLLRAFRSTTLDGSPLAWGISGSMRILTYYSSFDPGAKRHWDILNEMSKAVNGKLDNAKEQARNNEFNCTSSSSDRHAHTDLSPGVSPHINQDNRATQGIGATPDDVSQFNDVNWTPSIQISNSNTPMQANTSPSGVSDFLPTGLDLSDLTFGGDGNNDQWVFTSSGPVMDGFSGEQNGHVGNGSFGNGGQDYMSPDIEGFRGFMMHSGF